MSGQATELMVPVKVTVPNRNRRGEIDQLLPGPRGLFAIEVKNLNATVYTAGAPAPARARARAGRVGHRVDEP